MKTYSVLFPFCGLGGGALGFRDAETHLFGERARFEIMGGIDIDPEACADFEHLVQAPALCADIAKLTPEELRAFAGPRGPRVVFFSHPCKGATKLISDEQAAEKKYVELNRLGEIAVELVLATWPDDLPGLVLLENVPNLRNPKRGGKTLQAIYRRLRAAGYIIHEGTHECGELGGLAQIRRRLLIVARLPTAVPPLLYQPPKKRVRACGEVLGPLPMPEDPAGGPLHKLPRISWLNWVRLALIPAGGDWRDLPKVLEEGQPRREVFRRQHVEAWASPSITVAGPGSNGPYGVADPRVVGLASDNPDRHYSKYAVERWDAPSPTVTGATRPGSGSLAVADPRGRECFGGTYGVIPWGKTAGTVTGRAACSTGRFTIADPRVQEAAASSDLGCAPRSGAYGVLPWEEAAKTVTGAACFDNGPFAVVDPRVPEAPPVAIIDSLKGKPYRLVNGKKELVPVVILASDGTWHRPLTTLELAVLQGLPATVRGEPLRLAGESVDRWRERIGNAVPAPTAQAIAEQMLITLLSASVGGFSLSSAGGVWVEEAAAQ